MYLLPGIFLSRNIITNETTKTLIAFIGIAIMGFIKFDVKPQSENNFNKNA